MKIRICIGTEPKTEIARKVLQHSIISRTKAAVEFYPMVGDSWRQINQRQYGLGTGFSLKRWAIPERFDYDGWAIYLDSDILVLGDIADLFSSDDDTDTTCWCVWQTDKWFPKTPKPNTSVMLINCEEAKKDWWPIRKIFEYLNGDIKRKRYVEIMHALHLKREPGHLSEDRWNHLNKYKEGFTQLIHYTSEHQQPWYHPEHPFSNLWEKELKACLNANNDLSPEEIKVACDSFEKHSKRVRGQGMHPYWKKYAESIA